MKKAILRSSICSLAILLVACGGGGSGSSSSGGTTTPVTPTPTNAAPVVASGNSNQSAVIGAAFSYDATQSGTTFSDADGDTLSYSVSYSPASFGLTNSGGVISGTPTMAGTVTITITANDGNGGTITDTFTITVTTASTSTSPNILFVISDDQGKDASAEYSLSSDVPLTPNLTALADNGVIFENLWVSPTCSPTRAALITGKHGTRTNVFSPGDALPASETILQQHLKTDPSGGAYASAMIGKWHLGGGQSGPNDFGLDHFAGIIAGGVNDYFNWNFNVNGSTSNSTNYVTTELTDQAINWVGNQTTPWFLWLSYNAPHTPFHLPPTTLHSRSLTGTTADINANPRPYYLATIEALDTEFGRFWGSLSAAEQANTIVIYIGDNGTPPQVIDDTIQQRGNKGNLYQGGVNTPMFVSGAGVTRMGEREDALINHTDFFPTIAELTGAILPNFNDGKSFKGLLSAASPGPQDYTYTEQDTDWTIRNDQYKLIEDIGTGVQQLYDLLANPEESANLLPGSAAITAVLNELEIAADNIRSIINISGVKFSDTSALCTNYVDEYRAGAKDIGEGTDFVASLQITSTGSTCTFTSNSIPNHDFNDGAGFPNTTAYVMESFTFPVTPVAATNVTDLSLTVDNAILLNGVKVDVLAAACFGVGNEKIGCNDINQPWRFDPMHSPNGFNVDTNNAHTQPDGAYHYHGPPPVFNGNSSTVSGVIGYAADGFPIFGPYFDDAGTIRAAAPSYQLRSGSRPTGTGNPGGTYDGSFRDDYEFVSGVGDLDACNGMVQNGQYGYYVTAGFPYMVNCFTGTPDPSFNK